MKKFYSYLLSAAMLLSLAGCGSKTSNDDVMNVNIANIISADDSKVGENRLCDILSIM